MVETITPILLCGGAGTRLWPTSRKARPKQFVPLLGVDTLFQAAARRVSGPRYAPPIAVTHADFRFLVAEQLLAVGIDPGAILLEPAARGTAPAVLAAVLALHDLDDDHLFIATPVDHWAPDHNRFSTAVEAGVARALAGDIVTFGVTPDRPETGFGYLQLADEATTAATRKVVRFVEKPNAARAAEIAKDGRHLWNAGVFLFSRGAIMQAFEKHAPDILAATGRAVRDAVVDLGFLRLAPESWNALPTRSFDHAIMERTDAVTAVPYGDRWADLSAWDAVWQEAERDADGVATSGPATAIDCRSSLLRSDNDGMRIVGFGLRDIVAVAMTDAVLIADMRRAQDLGVVVETLRRAEVPQADRLPTEHRPWGWFESLVVGDRFQVKRIFVKPGARLSLQRHFHRSEHWIVVAGTARITIGEESQLLSENESVYVPLGVVHRLENPGRVPVELIEVQTGSYLGEDDIVRLDDMYARD